MKRLPGSPGSTPPTPALTPMTRVLQTTELLEAILMEISDLRHLFLSQRVCKVFHDTIRGSLLLRRKLFLSPAEPKSGTTVFNPILVTMAVENKPAYVKYPRSPFAYHPQTATHATLFDKYEPEQLKFVFSFNGKLYALTDVTRLQIEGRGFRIWSQELTDADEYLGWNLNPVQSEDKIQCPVVDLEHSSLRDVILTQPPVDLITFPCGGEFSIISPSENFIRLRSDLPFENVNGHSIADVESRGKTFGEIMGMVQELPLKYEVTMRKYRLLAEEQRAREFVKREGVDHGPSLSYPTSCRCLHYRVSS